MDTYYTIRLPYVKHAASPWHPTEATGPFAVLTRGAFASRKLAAAWAKEQRLAKGTYSIRKVGPPAPAREPSPGLPW